MLSRVSYRILGWGGGSVLYTMVFVEYVESIKCGHRQPGKIFPQRLRNVCVFLYIPHI